jgi:AraC family transcriptional regulator
MYQHGFQDLDGHIWEPFFMDPSFVQANTTKQNAQPQVEPRIVTKHAFTVVGMRINTTPKSPEIPALWDKLVPRMGEIRHGDEGRVSYGVMEGMNDKLVYMAGNPVTHAADLPAGMMHWDVPANTYVVFEATLPTIGEAFGKAHAWVASSEYHLGSGPHLERYGEDFSPENPRLEIFVPVVKKP